MKADDGSVGCRKGEVAAFLEQKDVALICRRQC